MGHDQREPTRMWLIGAWYQEVVGQWAMNVEPFRVSLLPPHPGTLPCPTVCLWWSLHNITKEAPWQRATWVGEGWGVGGGEGSTDPVSNGRERWGMSEGVKNGWDGEEGRHEVRLQGGEQGKLKWEGETEVRGGEKEKERGQTMNSGKRSEDICTINNQIPAATLVQPLCFSLCPSLHLSIPPSSPLHPANTTSFPPSPFYHFSLYCLHADKLPMHLSAWNHDPL